MADYGVRIAQLDEGRLEKLRALEKDLGECVVAVEARPKFATLSEDKLRRLQTVEKELGTVLLAYSCR